MLDRSPMGILVQSHVTRNGESPGRLRPELAVENKLRVLTSRMPRVPNVPRLIP